MRAAARDEPEPIAGTLPKFDGHPIANMELLGLDALVVENDLAAGQDAIDVGQHELDFLTPLGRVSCALPRWGDGEPCRVGPKPSGREPSAASGNKPTTSVMSISPRDAPWRR